MIPLNARGLNDDESFAFPYLKWLVHTHHPMFVFLSETKCMASAVSNFSLLNPNFVHGVDAIGSSGGLLLLG